MSTSVPVRVRAREEAQAPTPMSAIRREPCMECRTWIKRGDSIRRRGGRAYHLLCWPAVLARESQTIAQASRELFWMTGCPDCGAIPGRACVEDGQPRPRNHRARMRLYSTSRRQGMEPDPEKLEALRAARLRGRS